MIEHLHYVFADAFQTVDPHMHDLTKAYLNWLGSFHYVFLHFPIALTIMTACAELLYLKTGDILYRNSAQFMLSAAVVFVIPTALLGLALSYGAAYPEPFDFFFFWHRLLGIFTVCWAILTIIVRNIRYGIAYAICLSILVLSVFFTGFFGGNLAFGQETFKLP